MEDQSIFSGEASQELWQTINNLDALSTGEEIRDALYLMGCKLQELEGKFQNHKHISVPD